MSQLEYDYECVYSMTDRIANNYQHLQRQSELHILYEDYYTTDTE